MIEIKINCKGTDYFSLSELNILQDTKDFQLKELSKDNFEKLKNRIEKKGFWFPFFVWNCKQEKKWYYTDGTQRHKVLTWMQESGEYKLPDKFPCVEIFAKDKKEAAEAILTQSTNYGKITDEGLYGFLNEYDLKLDFQDLKLDLELPEINLEQFEIGYLIDNDNEKENDIPEVPTETNIKIGDMFELGNHNLLCGDSTNKNNIELLMNGNSANMIFTDPPYEIESTDIYETIKLINKNANILIFASDKQIPYVFKSNLGEFKRLYVLDTNIASSTNNDVYINHIALLRFKNGKSCKFNNIHNSGRSIIKIDYRKNLKDEKIHNHQKSIELLSLFIKYWSNENDIVVDLYGGAGSTLIAAEKNNRKCFMIELNPYYCDLIIQRFEDYTGIKAKQIN